MDLTLYTVLVIFLIGTGTVEYVVAQQNATVEDSGRGAADVIDNMMTTTTTNERAAPTNFKCLVCTGDKKVKTLYHKDCLSPTKELLSKADTNDKAWDCAQFNQKMDTALTSALQSRGLTPGATYDKNKCTTFNVCRSFYYESKIPYIKVESPLDKPEKEPMAQGKNERVFRFCGCTPGSTKEKELKGAAKVCSDLQRSTHRKRSCVCDPAKAKPGEVCNSARPILPLGFQLISTSPVILVVVSFLLIGSTWIFDGVAPA